MTVDRWLSRLSFGPDRPDDGDRTVEPIRPQDSSAIRLSWSSRFSSARLSRHVARLPSYNWWNPQTGEYLIAEPWRHREEIAAVLEVSGRRSRAALVRRLTAELPVIGVDLVLLSENEWHSHTRLYRELEFGELEKIVYYQLAGLESGPRTRRPLPELQFVPLGRANLAAVIQIDHVAFPWLWWNSEGEFTFYMGVPGVQAWVGISAGRPVGYAGFTTQGNWGHLDRIAVDPAAQGSSFGAAILAFTLGSMHRQGVTRVTLSTQSDNYQAHRLYEGFGFQQTSNSQTIVGRWLRPATGDE